MLADCRQPLVNVSVRVLLSKVEDEDDTVGIFKETMGEASVSVLASRVPNFNAALVTCLAAVLGLTKIHSRRCYRPRVKLFLDVSL